VPAPDRTARDSSAEETVSALRREQFPVTGEKAWLNTAAYGPLPAVNVAARGRPGCT
jgi:hypothetical protein